TLSGLVITLLESALKRVGFNDLLSLYLLFLHSSAPSKLPFCNTIAFKLSTSLAILGFQVRYYLAHKRAGLFLLFCQLLGCSVEFGFRFLLSIIQASQAFIKSF